MENEKKTIKFVGKVSKSGSKRLINIPSRIFNEFHSFDNHFIVHLIPVDFKVYFEGKKLIIEFVDKLISFVAKPNKSGEKRRINIPSENIEEISSYGKYYRVCLIPIEL